MDTSKTMHEYLNELSSSSPTPGGGNVAALCGTLSASLGMMVCNLTIGKKKYTDVEQEMIGIKEELDKFQKEFIKFGIQDNESFDKVMDAFKMPKETDNDKEIRDAAIEKATLDATIPPSNVLNLSNKLLTFLNTIILKGNKNSLSDAGVACALVGSAAKGAYMNILINIAALKNQTIAQEIKKRADITFEETMRISDGLVEKVLSFLKDER